MTFVDRHRLWSEPQHAAATAMTKALAKGALEAVRFVCADADGVLRGKSVIAADALRAMKSGAGLPRGAIGGGNGDTLMVPDPVTFRVLPWAPQTGWVLCDLYAADGKPEPFSTRQICRDALARLGTAGFDFIAGFAVEFHLYRLANGAASPPEVSAIAPDAPSFAEGHLDRMEAALEGLRRGLLALGLPLRAIETGAGASLVKLVFAPQAGLDAADNYVLLRAAIRQIAWRGGYFASFMCRPALPGAIACSLDIHQSLHERKTGTNAFALNDRDVISTIGRYYLGGLTMHARAAAAFMAPTVNGYRRNQPDAPDRIVWARDSRAALLRVLGQPGDPATRLVTRAAEPAANPYLALTAQIYCGLDGIARRLEPGPSADMPFETGASQLPKTLGEAVTALRADECLRDGFGVAFVEAAVAAKSAEWGRFKADTKEQAEPTAWEQREYFDRF